MDCLWALRVVRAGPFLLLLKTPAASDPNPHTPCNSSLHQKKEKEKGKGKEMEMEKGREKGKDKEKESGRGHRRHERGDL